MDGRRFRAAAFAASAAAVAVTILLPVAGCGGGGGGEADTVEEFLRAQSLPQMQTPAVKVMDGDTELFSVSFGEAQDCPSGCFYSGGIGLRRGQKIGWLRYENYEDVNDADRPLYDLDASDAPLFTAEFREALAGLRDEPRSQFAWHYERLLDLMARDGDTPRGLLSEFIDGLSPANYLRARLLVNNPAVRRDRELLIKLANLPPHPPIHGDDDVFEEVRRQAAALL